MVSNSEQTSDRILTSTLKKYKDSSYNKKVIVKTIKGSVHNGERSKIAGEH